MTAKIKTEKRLRIKLRWYKQGNVRCHYCSRICDFKTKQLSKNKATIDHKTPYALGGTNRQENLLLSCLECNFKKGDIEYEQFINP